MRHLVEDWDGVSQIHMKRIDRCLDQLEERVEEKEGDYLKVEPRGDQ